MKYPDLQDVSALEPDDGLRKLYKFLNGDDSVSPDRFDNLARTREAAFAISHRALRYVAKLNAIENALPTEQTSNERETPK